MINKIKTDSQYREALSGKDKDFVQSSAIDSMKVPLFSDQPPSVGVKIKALIDKIVA